MRYETSEICFEVQYLKDEHMLRVSSSLCVKLIWGWNSKYGTGFTSF